MSIPLTYTNIATAIGEVAIWWSGVESMAHGLALRLAILNDEKLQNEQSVKQLNLILANMGQRDLFAVVKALAFDGSPDDLFPRLEPVLNSLDNVERIDRNRFIHDSWFATGQTAERTTRTTKIVNNQGKRELKLNHKVDFGSFDEVDDLAKRLKAKYAQLEAIAEEVSARLAERERPKPEPRP